MIGKVTEFVYLKYVQTKLSKYNIKLVHFLQGRIRLQSKLWMVKNELITSIIERMDAEHFVYQVKYTKETGSLLITYDSTYLTTLDELENWFSILDEVYKKEY